MKRTSRKTKTSPNADLLELEYYTPQKTKLTQPATTSEIDETDEEKENRNGEKDTITIKGLSTKKPLVERDTEVKPSSSSALNMTKRKAKKGENEKDDKAEDIKFTEILETKYIPKEFLFREKEKEDMFSFILNCLRKKKLDSLLISGNPGTGKTLTISYVLRRLEEAGMEAFSDYVENKEELDGEDFPKRIKTFKFNAMNYKNPSDIIIDLMTSLGCDSPQKAVKGSSSTRILIDQLKQELVARNKNELTVVFVDEIDNLFNRHSVAGEMLELLKLPKFPNSNFILIGASNTIDLIVNLNQEYKISTEIKNIVFQPYSNDEIFSILKNRLYNTVGLEDKGKAFDETAVRFCSKKIYSLKGGDIRYVFEVIKKVYHKKINQSSDKEVEPKPSEAKDPKEEEHKKEDDEKEKQPVVQEPKITLSDMLKTFEELYGRNPGQVIDSMPQQQQMGLLALYLILSKKNSVLITKGDLLSAYNNISTANFLPKIDISTLEDILQTYESYDFVRLKSKKKAGGMPGKSPFKTLNKMLGDEVIPVITADQIKSTFEKSEFFARYLV